jgi:nucleotide-binding universal stress UspA family protein
MPLGVPLPDAEKEANSALERATEIVLLHGLPTKKVVQRARVAGEDIAKSAKELDVDMIVVGIQPEEGKGGVNPLGKTADAILKHSSCEVIIDKLP